VKNGELVPGLLAGHRQLEPAFGNFSSGRKRRAAGWLLRRAVPRPRANGFKALKLKVVAVVPFGAEHRPVVLLALLLEGERALCAGWLAGAGPGQQELAPDMGSDWLGRAARWRGAGPGHRLWGWPGLGWDGRCSARARVGARNSEFLGLEVTGLELDSGCWPILLPGLGLSRGRGPGLAVGALLLLRSAVCWP